ncbi:MAG: tyrosine-type recombinase/integrase [Agriterribacter sp.]
MLKQFLENQKECSFKNAPVKTAAATSTAKKSISVTSYIYAINWQVLHKMKQHLVLKAYSPSTIKTYLNELNAFLQTIRHHAAEDFTVQRLKDYLQYCATTLKLSENTLHSRMNALKFYYEQVLHKEKFFWEILRPKKQQLLPSFFNQNEITAIIKAAGNLKHKTMLMLAYASGLRISEVVNIQVKDIDSKRMCILIRQAKGKKDRIVLLSPVLLGMLRAYWKKGGLDRNGFLFPGQNKTEPYNTRSLQLVIASNSDHATIDNAVDNGYIIFHSTT